MEYVGYSVIDFETTGLYPDKGDRVVEVGIVNLDKQFNIVGQFETLINSTIGAGPTHLHGIKSKYLEHAPIFKDILSNIKDMMHGRVMVGHNLSFDKKFLRAEISKTSAKLNAGYGLCTMTYRNQFERISLKNLASQYGVYQNTNKAHSAIEDAMTVARLLPKMFPNFTIDKKLSPVRISGNDAELGSPYTRGSAHKRYPLQPAKKVGFWKKLRREFEDILDFARDPFNSKAPRANQHVPRDRITDKQANFIRNLQMELEDLSGKFVEIEPNPSLMSKEEASECIDKLLRMKDRY